MRNKPVPEEDALHKSGGVGEPWLTCCTGRPEPFACAVGGVRGLEMGFGKAQGKRACCELCSVPRYSESSQCSKESLKGRAVSLFKERWWDFRLY